LLIINNLSCFFVNKYLNTLSITTNLIYNFIEFKLRMISETFMTKDML